MNNKQIKILSFAFLVSFSVNCLGQINNASNGLNLQGDTVKLGGSAQESINIRLGLGQAFNVNNFSPFPIKSYGISVQENRVAFYLIDGPGSIIMGIDDVTGITISDNINNRGINGGQDFSNQYDDLTYVQKIYVDTLLSVLLSGLSTSPLGLPSGTVWNNNGVLTIVP